jgi:hypothetical protein
MLTKPNDAADAITNPQGGDGLMRTIARLPAVSAG